MSRGGFSTGTASAPLSIPSINDLASSGTGKCSCHCCGNCFFLAVPAAIYHDRGCYVENSRMERADVSLGGAVYAVVIVAILISSFYWRALGLMPL